MNARNSQSEHAILSQAVLTVHRSTSATLAGASGALLVLTIIVGMSLYLGYGRKSRHAPAWDGAAASHVRADARRILVATFILAAALFVLFLTTTAIGSS